MLLVLTLRRKSHRELLAPGYSTCDRNSSPPPGMRKTVFSCDPAASPGGWKGPSGGSGCGGARRKPVPGLAAGAGKRARGAMQALSGEKGGNAALEPGGPFSNS